MRIGRAIGCLVVLIGTASVGFAEWVRENSESLAWFHAVFFVDAKIGWAGGGNGTLLKTVEGGKAWFAVKLRTADTIRDIHFGDWANGWLLCDRGRGGSGKNPSYLLRTTDGGSNWATVELDGSSESFDRFVFQKDRGFLIGEGGVIAGLPDDAKARSGVALPVRFLMTDGVATESRLVLVGGGGSIVLSGDGGRTWRSAVFADERPAMKLNAVSFVDADHGWAVGNGGSIVASTDGGDTWRRTPSGVTADIFDIEFVSRSDGFAVGEGGVVLRSNDAGRTWSEEKRASGHRLERLAVAGDKIFAVGFGGTILSRELP